MLKYSNRNTEFNYKYKIGDDFMWDYTLDLPAATGRSASDNTASNGAKLAAGGVESETDNQEKLIGSLYPNPATDKLYIDLPAGYEESQLGILDIKGRIMGTEVKSNANKRIIDIKHLQSGIYMLELQSATHPTRIMRFIKQ